MKKLKFTAEFIDLLSDEHKHLAERPFDSNSDSEGTLFANGYGYKHFNPFSTETCLGIVKVLEESFLGTLNTIRHPLPNSPADMRKFKKKDVAPIGWKSSSAYYAPEDEYVKSCLTVADANSCMPCSEAFATAMKETNLYKCFTSDSYWNWLSNVLGESLDLFDLQRDHGVQVSRYVAGDGIGLHNDYYGTKKKASPFYDIHCSFATNVASQLMFFGHDYLDQQVDLSGIGSIGIYRLPLWHEVSPLIPEKGYEETANRWLIISDLWYKD